MTAALIVDDEPAILRLVAMVLRELGFETLTAPDAETAGQLLRSSKPDLIVTDVRLPGASGIDLAKQVKSNKRLAKTPVLLMSAFGEPPLHAGDGFIPKPFDLYELEQTLNRYIDTDDIASENGETRRGQGARR
jgi:DNA-binding response OmpR family regulator